MLFSIFFIDVKRDLQGKSQATYVLGIGGMKREAIVMEEKANMLKILLYEMTKL